MRHYMLGAIVVMFYGILFTNQARAQELFSKDQYPQVYCLAQNIYYEARGSNLADRAAVADVVMNRVEDTRYPNTVCEVVKQGKQDRNRNMVRNMCQFSWYCDGKSDIPRDVDLWADAQMLAWSVLYFDKYDGITEGATHYHATYVNPKWAKDMQLVGRIGAHIFYRWE